MRWIRYLLAILSVVAAVGIIYEFFAHHPRPEWPIFVLPPLFILNAFCLLNLKSGENRIFKLVSLWFDAKEKELRDRAKPKY